MYGPLYRKQLRPQQLDSEPHAMCKLYSMTDELKGL